MFEIEKGVIIPPANIGRGGGKRGRSGRPPVYPYSKMEIGDSVFVEGATSKSKEVAAARAHAYKTGKRFAQRAMETGIRVWRVV